MPKERHPFWFSVPTERREAIVGDCRESVVKRVDVVVDAGTLDNATLRFDVTCQKYPNGETLDVPVDVFNELEREVRIPYVLTLLSINLAEICKDCPYGLKNQ